MSFIAVNEQCQVECVKVDKDHHYYLKEDGEQPYSIGQHSKSPLALGKTTEIGKQIYNQLLKNKELQKKCIDEDINKKQDIDSLFSKEYNKLMEALAADIIQQEKKQEAREKESKIEEETKYEQLYADFKKEYESRGYTPLEYIIRICEALGVDAHLELMKAFLGDLQTLLGLKGTNVIAIGGQASGKTHCIEAPHGMLLPEYVHSGTISYAAFFKKYNTQDLTGHIFYLGDLGGEKDDENTIVMRDLLKKLSTDGIARRELVDTNDNSNSEEYVTGYPAISYTTVSEDIINDQEKSRSIILYPPTVDQRKLMVFDSFIESPGADFDLSIKIKEAKETVQGYVWHLKQTIDNFELYNPYMFGVQYFLRDMPDFNRKIKEFNRLLLLICLLKGSFNLKHKLYYDEDEEQVETTVMISGIADVLDALTLFEGSSGLLPTELELAKGLLKKYTEYSSFLEQTTFDSEEGFDFEKMVKNDFTKILRQSNEIRVGALDLDAVKGYDTLTDDDGELLNCFFTIKDLRKNYRTQRWYREVSKSLSARLDKLYNYGFLIKIGKAEDGSNIYGLNHKAEQIIEDAKPMFKEADIQMGIDEFHRKYPELADEFDAFMEVDRNRKVEGNTFVISDDTHLFDLPWNKLDLKK